MDKCEDCTDVPPFYVSYNCHGNGIYHIHMHVHVCTFTWSVYSTGVRSRVRGVLCRHCWHPPLVCLFVMVSLLMDYSG